MLFFKQKLVFYLAKIMAARRTVHLVSGKRLQNWMLEHLYMDTAASSLHL